MDYAGVDRQVAANVREAIAGTIGSVNRTAALAGIPYTTLDRKLRRGSFTVPELFALAEVLDCRPASFLPDLEDAA